MSIIRFIIKVININNNYNRSTQQDVDKIQVICKIIVVMKNNNIYNTQVINGRINLSVINKCITFGVINIRRVLSMIDIVFKDCSFTKHVDINVNSVGNKIAKFNIKQN